MVYFICLILGGLAGFISGLFGIGGGIITVPLISYVLLHSGFPAENIMHYAVGTSLAIMIFTTSASSYFHHRKKSVLWSLFWYLAPGMVLGGFLGGFFSDYLPKNFLKAVFSLLCLTVALLFVRARFKSDHHDHDDVKTTHTLPIPHWALTVLGLLVGSIASMIGVGGGIILIPILTHLQLTLKKASALAVSCTLPTVMAGTLSAIYFGWDAPSVPLPTWGYVIVPLAIIQGLASMVTSHYGVELAHHLPKHVLRRLMAGILIIIAWIMMPHEYLSYLAF